MSQPTPARILLVEDSDDDAFLIERELERAGIAFESRRVDTGCALRAALREFAPDIVLTDPLLTPFTTQDALAVIREAQPHIPVLIVAGWLDGERAAEYMRSGASDYVSKHQLFRLADAVKRALALRKARAEAHEAEMARGRSEERFRKLVEHASDAITLLAASGHITYSTGAVTPTLGYEIGELTGRNVFEIVHADDRARAQALLAEVLLRERAVVRSTLRVRHQDGSWRYLDVIGANHLSDPALDGIVVRYHDVTARHRAEAAARAIEEQRHQTQKMEAISRLATQIAHDFNNVLSVIRGSCDFALLAVDKEDTQVRTDLLIISDATKGGARLTGELIASARQQPGSRQHVDLNEFIERMTDAVRHLLGEHVAVDFEPAASLGKAWVDAGELERVVRTLAVEAGKSMPAGGTLTLVTRDVEVDPGLADAYNVKPGPYVQLAVGDTGAGMDPETRSRAFEPVFTHEPEGTDAGFGLPAVYRVIQRWGGFVRLDSEVDKGTTCHLFLPWKP